MLDLINQFEISLYGGFAIYFALCTAYVTLAAIYDIGKWLVGLLK